MRYIQHSVVVAVFFRLGLMAILRDDGKNEFCTLNGTHNTTNSNEKSAISKTLTSVLAVNFARWKIIRVRWSSGEQQKHCVEFVRISTSFLNIVSRWLWLWFIGVLGLISFIVEMLGTMRWWWDYGWVVKMSIKTAHIFLVDSLEEFDDLSIFNVCTKATTARCRIDWE